MKNKFIKSTLILIIGGFITKVLSMFIKIIMTRNITEDAMSLYMLTLPTYNLFITLVTSGMQISTSKLVSENKLNKKKIISTSLFITLIISIILIIVLILYHNKIAMLLHNEKLNYPILSIILSLPFIGISSIIRGYFLGLNKMHVQVISNFVEQIIRIILFTIFLPKIEKDVISISFIIGSNLISEIASIITMSLYLPNKKIDKEIIKYDKDIKNEIISISIPSTTSRIVGTISYFFEPIILTNFLLINGYDANYINYNYGIITGYSMQLLLLPSFFSMAISQSIIPLISNAFINKKYKYIKKKIKEIILLSFVIGFSYLLIIYINPEFFLNLIYNTKKGANFVRILAPFFLLLYIQTPLTSILQSINSAKESMKATIIGSLIKIVLIIVFSYLRIGMYAFIIPMIINIIYVTIHNYISINKKINSFL